MNNLISHKRLILLSVVVVAAAVIGGYLWQRSRPSLPLASNNMLKTNIDGFMESQVTGNSTAREVTLGSSNYHCGHLLFGTDSKYAYAWVYCSGFIAQPDGSLKQGGGFMAPYRFAYTQPDLKIVDSRAPDDSRYLSDLKLLFPQKYYDQALKGPSNAERVQLMQAVLAKAKASSPSQ